MRKSRLSDFGRREFLSIARFTLRSCRSGDRNMTGRKRLPFRSLRIEIRNLYCGEDIRNLNLSDTLQTSATTPDTELNPCLFCKPYGFLDDSEHTQYNVAPFSYDPGVNYEHQGFDGRCLRQHLRRHRFWHGDSKS